MSSKKDCCKKNKEKKCLNALKNINVIEDKINVELEKAKLLLSLLNCDTLGTIQPELQKIFEELKNLEDEVTTIARTLQEP